MKNTINFVLGASRLRSPRNPIIKILIEPKIIEPNTWSLANIILLNFCTANPTIITNKKDRRTTATPNLGIACL